MKTIFLNIKENQNKKNESPKEAKLNFFMVFWLLFIYKKGKKGLIL